MAKQKDLVINQWTEGVASSPIVGYNMRNVDLDTIGGIVKINTRLDEMTNFNDVTYSADTFTVDIPNDEIVIDPAQDLADGTGVILTNAGGSGNEVTAAYPIHPGGDFLILDVAVGFPTGTAVTISDSDIGGLADDDYYIKRFSDTTYEVHNNEACTDLVSLTSVGTCTVTATATSLPYPLATDTTYYTHQVTTTEYQLMLTYDDAVAGTNAVDIKLDGSGTHTVTPYTTNSKINYFVEDGGTTYAGDDNNGVWKVKTTGPWQFLGEVTGGVDGMVLWKDYLLCAQSDQVDAYNVSTGVWTRDIMDASLQVSATDDEHFMHIGADDQVYIANGRYLAKIKENAGQTFDPGNGATYTAPANVLDLPTEETITSITTLGVDLMIGTDHSKIYRWDRTSDTFYNPLKIEAGPIDLLVTLGNLVYIFPSGTTSNFSNIYVTDGTTVTKIAEIPKYLIGEAIRSSSTPKFYNGGGYIYDGKIYFTVGGSASGAIGYAGIWSLSTDGVLNYENQNSQNELGINGVTLGACTSKYVSYSTGGTPYVDSFESQRYTNYKAFIESPLMRVGTSRQRKTFRQFEIYLSEPLASGEGIKLSVRNDRTETYSVVATIDYDTYGAIQHYQADYFFEGENLQLKAELTTGGNSSSTPELIEVRIR